MTLSAGTARLLLLPILLAYGYLAFGYARATPRWNNPDEPAHVNVVRHIAQTGTLPVLQPGDWDSDLLARLTTAWFPNDYEIDGIRYEGHQPPLYYLLAAPVHRLTADQPINRQVLALRLFSAMIGGAAVVAAFVVAREAAPERPVLAVLTAATVAFVPMNTAISAAVNNDSLATALAAVTLAALMVGRRHGFSDRWAVGLGLLIGALVLTKLTVYVFVPLILGTLLAADLRPSLPDTKPSPPQPPSPSSTLGPPLRGANIGCADIPSGLPRSSGRGGSIAGRASPRRQWESGGRFLPALRWPLIACGVAALVCGWWLIRNMLVYGLFDPLAMLRHDQIVVGQPRWTTYDLEALDFFFRILFRSFWGMFGWMGVVLDDGFYILYLVLTALGVTGVLVGRQWQRGPHPPTPSPASGRGGSSIRSAIGRNVVAEAGGRPASVASASIRAATDVLPFSRLRERGPWGSRAAEGPHGGLWGGEGFIHWPLQHTDLLAWATLLVFGEVAYYNLTFIQPQGRYLFPALVPIALFLANGWWHLAAGAIRGPTVRLLTAGVLAAAIAWGLGEAHGALRAAELWSDNALIGAAVVGALAVLALPFVVPPAARRWMPDALCLLLALALGLLDYAALLKFVGPAFPFR